MLYVPPLHGRAAGESLDHRDLFTVLTLSGLAMFTPYLFSLTGLFGGGQATRAIHPCSASLCGKFLLPVRAVLATQHPQQGRCRVVDEDRRRGHQPRGPLPELGKYNAGQKGVFWGQTALIGVMFVTGLVIWNTYFGGLTSIETQRWRWLPTSLAAVIAIAISWSTSTPASGARHRPGDGPRHGDRRAGPNRTTQVVPADRWRQGPPRLGGQARILSAWPISSSVNRRLRPRTRPRIRRGAKPPAGISAT